MSACLLIGLSALSAAIGLVPQDPPPTPPTPPAAPYRVLQTFHVGGDSAFDCVTVDAKARRLYVPRGTRVMVLDADTGREVGEIADTAGVRGVALATALGRGFTSNNKAGTTTVFDLEKGKPLATVKTDQHPNGLVYDSGRRRVYVANIGGENVTVVDADKLEAVGTIALGGKPEGMVTDADGRVFVNLQDTSEIVGIDPAKLAVDQRFKLAPGKGPDGLAIDPEQHRLFAACHNAQLVVLDARSGSVLATPAIGKPGGGAAFDAEAGYVLCANGDGTLTVVATRGDKPFTVVQTLTTAAGAHTLALDTKTHRVYLPTADFADPGAPAENGGGGRRRPAAKPGSFKILVVGS
jgi:DNA-binding beta-propeller fold protein YncE